MSTPPPPGTGPDDTEAAASPDSGPGPYDADRGWQSLAVSGLPAPPRPPDGPSTTPPGGTAMPHPHTVHDRVADPMPIPRMPGGASGATGPAPATGGVKIGVWGASGAGKTTFIGALPIAAMQHQRRGGANWVISGMDPSSSEFLNDSVEQMVVHQRFPEATRARMDLRWSFFGEELAARRFRAPQQTSFALEVLDLPGEAFNPKSGSVSAELHEQAVSHLSSCGGLLYLFDPLLDANKQTESIRYFFGTAQHIASRVRDEGRMQQNRLPQRLAVCITKFDHPQVFEAAVRAGWVTQDGTGTIPYVPDHQGQGFFNWICDTFRGSSARLVRDGLTNFFHPDRLSFHVSSAIGFRLNPNNQFDYRSYVNVEPDGAGERICGSPPMPINVIEPLMALEGRIRSASKGRRGR
jgi:hypothetical protein